MNRGARSAQGDLPDALGGTVRERGMTRSRAAYAAGTEQLRAVFGAGANRRPAFSKEPTGTRTMDLEPSAPICGTHTMREKQARIRHA